MPNNQDFSSQTCSSVEDTISRIIEGYPSIKRFKSKNCSLANLLSFTPVSIEEVIKLLTY